MFGDGLKIKALLAGFLGYLIVSVLVMSIVVSASLPAGVTDPVELSRIAESDPHLLMWQVVLGTVLGVLAGFVTCHVAGAKGLKNSLILGVLFAAYGVVGIILHPTHTFPMQAAKVVSPIPLTLFGGWLRLVMAWQSSVSHAQPGVQADVHEKP